jgi:hypothetical protein
MSESEKKGSAWPWIAVPVCAMVLFGVLRYCQQRLPPAEHAPSHAVKVPAAPDSPSSDPKPAPAEPGAAPAPAPTPQ